MSRAEAGGGNVQAPGPVRRAAMKERVQKIFRNLAPSPDAVVFVNSAEPHIDQSFYYVFDTSSGIFEGSVAIARPDGTTDVLSSKLEEESARQAARSDPSVRVSVMNHPDDRKKWVAEQLGTAKSLAANFREITHEDFRFLETVLPRASWADASTAVRKARMVKDAKEIERIRRAGAIGSIAAEAIPGLIREGMTEIELASEIEHRMNLEGATGRSFATIVGFGPNSAEPHYSPHPIRLQKGQSIVCDFGCLHERYASDITRSFRFAPGNPEMKKVHETVQEAQAAALAVIRAGVPGKEPHLAAQKVVDASPWKGRFIHGLGHSVGLAVHDGYGMGPNTDEPLQAGMVVTVEPGIYLPGKGGVRIEDDIVVTETGYTFLTTAPREYIEVGS
jgi:Xaa-Pro dipeptidase